MYESRLLSRYSLLFQDCIVSDGSASLEHSNMLRLRVSDSRQVVVLSAAGILVLFLFQRVSSSHPTAWVIAKTN